MIKLQEGVTEVLPKLHRAGIAVWVLTGDKIDTATEIGYTTGLLRAEMNVVTIPEQVAESAAPQGFVDTGDNAADDDHADRRGRLRPLRRLPGARASFDRRCRLCVTSASSRVFLCRVPLGPIAGQREFLSSLTS